MKDHPNPTKEQMEEAEEIIHHYGDEIPKRWVQQAMAFMDGNWSDFLVKDIANLLAQREAQAEKRGAEKVVNAAERGLEECKHFYEACTCELEATRKALEDLTPKT